MISTLRNNQLFYCSNISKHIVFWGAFAIKKSRRRFWDAENTEYSTHFGTFAVERLIWCGSKLVSRFIMGLHSSAEFQRLVWCCPNIRILLHTYRHHEHVILVLRLNQSHVLGLLTGESNSTIPIVSVARLAGQDEFIAYGTCGNI